MEKKYNREQLWKLYKELPEDLQEALFSEETTNTISDICEKNNINDSRKITEIIGLVLLGLLPPSELEKTLKKDLSLSAEKSKKVFGEINSFLLYPLKNVLTDLYSESNLKFKSIATKARKSPLKKASIRNHSGKNDSYRESFN